MKRQHKPRIGRLGGRWYAFHVAGDCRILMVPAISFCQRLNAKESER